MSLGSTVGSKTASVAGGVPVPLARVTVPPWAPVAVTLQEAIDVPSGAVMVVVTSTGLATTVPSAGDGGAMTGGACCGVPPVPPPPPPPGTGIVHEMLRAFETARRPLTKAVAVIVSLPATRPV